MDKEYAKKNAEILKAYADGKPLQYMNFTDKEWIDCSNPSFDFTKYQYRIKPEPNYRPYKDCDEMIDDFDTRFGVCHDDFLIPLIWLKYKYYSDRALILNFNSDDVCLGGLGSFTLSNLMIDFTYLDGSPVGKLKE